MPESNRVHEGANRGSELRRSHFRIDDGLGIHAVEAAEGRQVDPLSNVIAKAIPYLVSESLPNAKFAKVCELSGISKATGYRFFPSGMESIIEYLHKQTLVDIVRSLRIRLTALPSTVEFETAIEIGMKAAIEGLRTTPWTALILRSDVDLMTTYLLAREPGSLCHVLAKYIEQCAANFGTMQVDTFAIARRFVWSVFARLLSEFPEDPSSPWPDPDSTAFSALVDGSLSDFVKAVGLEGARRLRLAVPIKVADADGPGMPFAVLA